MPEFLFESISRGISDKGIGALSTELHGMVPVAGFEPASSRLTGEVTFVFTTGRTCFCETSLLNSRRGTCEKRFDSRLEFAATLGFGTTPPDPCGSRRCRRSVARQGSRPCCVDRFERSSSSLHHRRNFACPQGLKPASFAGSGGTAEAVPFPLSDAQFSP
jgi:hypothetical protein